MLIWNQVKDSGADLLTWWQHLVKKGILHLAKVRARELLKQRRGHLNLLLLRQAYLTCKVSNGDLSSLTTLSEVKLRISKWFKEESEKIILFSRANDMNFNEKVRIFHHDLHRKFKQKSAILKLQTPIGIVEGHAACAAAVEESVEAHLQQPAVLDPDQPSAYRLTIYRQAIIGSFSKYRINIDIAFFLKISHDINNEVCTVNCLQFASKIKIT